VKSDSVGLVSDWGYTLATKLLRSASTDGSRNHYQQLCYRYAWSTEAMESERAGEEWGPRNEDPVTVALADPEETRDSLTGVPSLDDWFDGEVFES
jgi:hypothetical protein